MKIAIFENEFQSVKGAFDTASLLNFNSQLEYEIFTSSQQAEFNKLNDFLAIFIDIDLAPKSELDGYALIKKISSFDQNLIRKVIILTGNNKIKEALDSKAIDSSLLQIIIKPTNYEEITSSLKFIINQEKSN